MFSPTLSSSLNNRQTIDSGIGYNIPIRNRRFPRNRLWRNAWFRSQKHGPEEEEEEGVISLARSDLFSVVVLVAVLQDRTWISVASTAVCCARVPLRWTLLFFSRLRKASSSSDDRTASIVRSHLYLYTHVERNWSCKWYTGRSESRNYFVGGGCYRGVWNTPLMKRNFVLSLQYFVTSK